MDPWLQKAHARVLTNTVSALRSLKRSHEEGCLEDALRTYMLNATPEEAEALQSADDQRPIRERLSAEDRDRLQRLYPLAFLSYEAQELPLDLGSVWHRTLVEQIASESARGTAYFRSRVSLHAVSMRHPCLQPRIEDEDAHACANDGDSADPQRKRARLDHDETATVEHRTLDHPGMQWLRELPNAACVAFAKNCVAQSQRLARDRRKRSDDAHGSVAAEESAPVSASTKLLLESIQMSERHLQIHPPAAAAPYTHPARLARSSRQTARRKDANDTTPVTMPFPPEGSFEWSAVHVPQDDERTAQRIQTEFMLPADAVLRALPMDGVLSATFDARNNFSWCTIEGGAATRMRLPNNLRAVTIKLVGRGEAAAASARFK